MDAAAIDNLCTLSEHVHDEDSFLEFLAALAADWEARFGAGPGEGAPDTGAWENDALGAFLAASADWGQRSIDGLPLYESPLNPWRRAADILHAGKWFPAK